jgi:hypothetical protein
MKERMQLRSQGWYRRITNHDDANSLSSRLRRRRLVHVTKMIQAIFDAKGAVSIIDVGGEPRYWDLFPGEFLVSRNVTINLVNLTKRGKDTSLFQCEEGNGCALRHANQSFDIAHSNSVIEHVGSWSDMEAFAHEMRRVGRAYYVQTPSYWFPVEPHFGLPGFHWLPRSARIALVQRYPVGHYEACRSEDEAAELVDSARLLTTWQMRRLFGDAQIVRERLGPLTKSVIAIRQSGLAAPNLGSGSFDD